MQKRDNQYYLERLKNEHPSIYADYLAKKFKNAAEAFVKAGLRKPKTPLDALQAAWNKASAADKDTFRVMIGCVSAAPATPSAVGITSPRIGGPTKGMSLLPPSLASEVRAIIARRQITVGTVMRELGKSPLNASLGMSLERGTQVQDSLITALTEWVARHRNA
jgi:hypothetical protein